tara:strand:- start:35193 stop:35849 length:657 start_codon:yes stop_codon:yes gene_type:complete
MANMKHIGQVTNTGLKCIIVFRELYDDKGNVEDPNHCLVVETERLPDMLHDDMVRVVESPTAQDSQEFYTVAHRSLFSDGVNMLVKLHNHGLLKKYQTKDILVTPNSYTSVPLNEINEIVKKTNSGMSPQDIQNSMVNDTDSAPRTSTSLSATQTNDQAIDTNEDPMSDLAIAKTMVAQADTYELEVKRLREEAYAMAPNLKPKRGRPKTKVTADANS